MVSDFSEESSLTRKVPPTRLQKDVRLWVERLMIFENISTQIKELMNVYSTKLEVK